MVATVVVVGIVVVKKVLVVVVVMTILFSCGYKVLREIVEVCKDNSG